MAVTLMAAQQTWLLLLIVRLLQLSTLTQHKAGFAIHKALILGNTQQVT
jgi:hypothetical protein